MVDWHKARDTRWSYMHLNRHDEPIGLLDGVTGAKVRIVAQSPLGGSGEMTLTECGQDIDWMRDRVQIIYDPGIPGVEPWPVATFMFTSPTVRHTSLTTSYAVTLTTKVAVIDSATVPAGFSIPAGTNAVDAVVQLIQSTGETRIAVTPSDAVTTNMIVFDEGATKREVINKLLTEVAGYWSLWCDGSGQFRVEPYLDPALRPVAFEFKAGPTSVHRPAYEREFNASAVPNVFRVYCEGDEENPPIVGEYVNEDPDSPYSLPSRGFEVSQPPERVEVATVQEANDLARRRLLDQMAPVARLKAEHALVPLEPNQVVRFTPSRGPAVLATVQSMAFDCVMNGHVSAEWREVML